jgi:glycosidase
LFKAIIYDFNNLTRTDIDMVKKSCLLFFTLVFATFVYSQQIKIDKIEPPNWWTGMNWNTVQLMVYGENLTDIQASFDNKKLEIVKIHKVESEKPGTYSFIDVKIPDDLKPGDYKLTLKNGKSSAAVHYSIFKSRDSREAKGFSPEDVIYLIMPDRFANGDTTNDIIVEGYGKNLDRNDGQARHGGDIQGMIDHLDYIKEAGFTALWINPVVENNTEVSYHGYGATDFYKVDPRLGTNELYKKFVDEAHKRGLKVILDHVANHIHINHPWMKNLPLKEWINGSKEKFEITNHDKAAIVDIHGSKSTLENSTRGWFTDYMPDLKVDNPYMGTYVIQNTIWWMEYAGIDGIREDTYPYADPKFMSEWGKAILDEYPNTNIVGEVWKGDPVILSAYQEKSILTPGFDSHLPSVTDFGLADAFKRYLSGTHSISHIYDILAMDLTYHNPDNLVTFIDNHDVERGLFAAKEDVKKLKLAYQVLLTTRGIPQILYASEVAAVGGPDHGSLRTDFPGGFPGDTRSAFKAEERTAGEKDMYDFFKQMLTIRKENKALSNGKLVHFPVQDNVYIYFRILDNEKIMVVVNDNSNDKKVDLTPVISLLDGTSSLKELKSGAEVKISGNSITVPGKDAGIYKVN